MKKIVAILMAAVMCLTMCVSVSAALSNTENYTLEFKFLDEDGEVITAANPGDTVYLGVYFYKTAGAAAVEIAAFKNSSFMYGIGVPGDILPELVEADGESYASNVVTGCNSADVVGDGEYAWIAIDIDITAGVTTTATAPVSKVKFVLPETLGEYEFINDDISFAVADEFGKAAKCDLISATLTVEEGAPAEPTVGATTAVATNGVASEDNTKTYDNAFAVSTSVTPVAGTTAIGVLFAPKAWLGDKALEATLSGVANATKSGLLGVAASFTAAIKDIPRALNDKEFVMVTRAYAYDGTTYTYGAAAETTVEFTNTGE